MFEGREGKGGGTWEEKLRGEELLDCANTSFSCVGKVAVYAGKKGRESD